MQLRDLRQLEAFRFLAQTRNFAETAQHMGVTSSAISHSLKNLETSLDCKLLTRGNNSLTLTRHGEILLRHSNVVLSRLDLAYTELTRPIEWGNGSLRIGAEDSIAGHMLPDVLLEMRAYFPNANFEVCTERTGVLMEQLQLGQLDIVVGIDSQSCRKSGVIQRTPLFTEDLCFLLPKDHSSCSGKPLNWSEEKTVFVLEGSAEEEEPIHSFLKRLDGNAGSIKHLQSGETLKRFVMAGMGVGIASHWMIASAITSGALSTIRIDDKAPQRSWAVFSNEDSAPDILKESLIGLLRHSSHIIARSIHSLSTPVAA